MATVFPSTLTFFRGASSAPQVQVVKVVGENMWVTVSGPPVGTGFSWPATPAGGVLLNPPAAPHNPTATALGPAAYKPPMSIPVTFAPASAAEVQATMTVNLVRNDATRSAIPGFPTTIALKANAPGVGPGTLKIWNVDYNPDGPDLAGEYVEIVNNSGATLDLQGCRVGDFRTRRGPRLLFEFKTPFSLVHLMAPADVKGPRVLRIYTGPGVAPDPAFAQIALKRGAPVWNNAGDTAWISNQNGQPVDTYVYPPAGTAPTTAPRPGMAVTRLGPRAGLTATGLLVEEGDRLEFSAFGQIWVGVGHSGGESGPKGKGDDPAGIGWPVPDAPPLSLVGRIGTTGRFFAVGEKWSLVVDDAEGELFLLINDINLGDNWGAGYTCTVFRNP
jgi:hypothetical protein